MFQTFSAEADQAMTDLLEQLRNLSPREKLQDIIQAKQKELEKLKQRRTKLLAYNTDGQITDEDFIAFNAELRPQIAQLEESVPDLPNRRTNLTKRISVWMPSAGCLRWCARYLPRRPSPRT